MTCATCGRDGGHGATGLSGCPYEATGGARGARGADVTWPGGRVFENLADHPVRLDSPAELRSYLRQTNQQEFVRHAPPPGSDKSPHTTNWATISPETLTNARIMLERVGVGSTGRLPDYIRSLTTSETIVTEPTRVPRDLAGAHYR